ncbi:hypothetical protein N665_0064s0071 [Sinapis alba]|nr:hypothetical protein N665_0064s0071 [Sinapis alba]
METKNDEPITKGQDNTFTLQNVIFIVKVSAVLAFSGYWGYPKIFNLLEGFDLWFRLVLRNVFFIFIIVNALIGSIFFSFLKTNGKKKTDLYDEYISVVRPSPETSSYQEITVPQFQAVNTVKEIKCYERVVMETSSKSYKRTTSLEKKKMRSTVEYRRTESERVLMKTASWRRSQAMDELSSEEFRMKVETFIMGYKKKMNCQNGDVYQWQDQPDHNGTGRHSSRRRLVGGSGSTGNDGPYLAISN